LTITLKHFFYWSVAGLALLALAAPFPDLATLLVVILIVGVAVTHASTYIGFVSKNTPPSVSHTGGAR